MIATVANDIMTLVKNKDESAPTKVVSPDDEESGVFDPPFVMEFTGRLDLSILGLLLTTLFLGSLLGTLWTDGVEEGENVDNLDGLTDFGSFVGDNVPTLSSKSALSFAGADVGCWVVPVHWKWSGGL